MLTGGIEALKKQLAEANAKVAELEQAAPAGGADEDPIE